MAIVTVNKYNATRRLREAGFDEKQAETVVRVLSDGHNALAKQSDIDAKLEGLEMRLTFKISLMLFLATCLILA